MSKFFSKIKSNEVIVGLLSGFIGAGLSAWVTYSTHSSDIDVKMVELSIGILRSEVKPETSPLREWAIDVINKRSGFTFSERQKAALLNQELPFKGDFSFLGFDRGFRKLDDGMIRQPPDQNRAK